MKRLWTYLATALVTLGALSGCLSQKYIALKGTSVPNPPSAPIRVAITEFPVASKATVVDPVAAISSRYDPGARSGGTAASAGGMLANVREIEIARPSRIEDLAGAVLRELRLEKVRVFVDHALIRSLEDVRRYDNPFELVSSESGEAELEVSGKALIRSRRVSKAFTRETDSVEIVLFLKDLETGRILEKESLKLGINLVFNSAELEEAMAVAVVTHLMQKTPF